MISCNVCIVKVDFIELVVSIVCQFHKKSKQTANLFFIHIMFAKSCTCVYTHIHPFPNLSSLPFYQPQLRLTHNQLERYYHEYSQTRLLLYCFFVYLFCVHFVSWFVKVNFQISSPCHHSPSSQIYVQSMNFSCVPEFNWENIIALLLCCLPCNLLIYTFASLPPFPSQKRKQKRRSKS